ncbi:MAG: MATE family efflux transporter [Alphaproteobacteria bacterium]|nr:MATE family efflux transporter [Alphaproteobacteria bacterium]MBU1514192.1 MATE family efflux transporter [Alphaproteobacteria bacterium]MBU2096159.1 MATE family efflux transporter [Alphaproteobacteria bacterium]MBU2151113.1 MATE family efflux transporter [Alphaproteobacteria bacterium]MBU2307228.1 MATE family efflux transporter [Alphaproteobacteria bacterium]
MTARAPGGPPGRKMPDLTQGPIGKTLILFALPVLATNILQSLNGSANAIWVSHVLGEAALTATSNANQIMFLMLGAVFGLSMASNIMIGQAMGGKDLATAKKVIGTSTAFFIVVSLSVGALGVTLTPHILTWMGTPAEAKADAIAYLRVIFSAMPFMYFFSYVMMAQRGTGDSRTPFYFSLVAVGMDVILNPMLITGFGPFPRMGIAGSATATLVSQTITLLAMIIHLYRKKSILVLRPGEFHLLIPDFGMIRALVLKGLPMGFQMIVTSLAAVTMMSLVNKHGVHTSAAYGAAAQLWTYVQMPAMALGAAVSSMAAQNVGAGRMDRVERIARSGAWYALLFTATPVVLIYLADPWVLRAFLPGDSPSLPIAVHINSIVLWGFIFFGMAFIFSGVVRATGAVWPPLLAMIVSLWGIRVPLANFLEPRMGADAIWISFPIGSGATLILAFAYYMWGGWRKSRMLPTTSPATDEPDTGFGQPMIEGAEAMADAAEASRSAPSAPNRPTS